MENKKTQELNHLIETLSICEKCKNKKKKNGKDCSLINIFQDKKFCKQIPSIWTDWYNRLDSKIMIIGQDWGPLEEMKKFHEWYLLEKSKQNWKEVIKKEKSLTKKILTNYLIESANSFNYLITKEVLDKIYFTNAILCARKGNNYRSDNIKLKESTLDCSNYLKHQIEIVKPKVILTLGYYPILSLSNIYNFKVEDTLKKIIKDQPEIKINQMILIPLYHPTAQVKKEEQLKQYQRIWKYIGKEDLK